MNELLNKINQIEKFVGNTPTYKLDFPNANLFAKLEFNSFMGSLKDRPAVYALKKAIEAGKVNEDTHIVESSSGNLALGIAGVCKCLGIKFISVIDPNITKEKAEYLHHLADKVIMVREEDETGSYLLSRIKTVKEIIAANNNYFNINQYENCDNYLSYYDSLGVEICKYFDRLDYIFISVSTGGTITGVSLRVKEKFPHVKIVAVDIEGSLAIGGEPKKRNVSGLGASRRSSFIHLCDVDEKVILSQREIESGCEELLQEQMIFAGASSGGVYAAAKKVLANCRPDSNALIICPDRGYAYLDTIYNRQNRIYEEKIDVVSETGMKLGI